MISFIYIQSASIECMMYNNFNTFLGIYEISNQKEGKYEIAPSKI